MPIVPTAWTGRSGLQCLRWSDQLKEIFVNLPMGNAGKLTEVWMDDGASRGDGLQKVNYSLRLGAWNRPVTCSGRLFDFLKLRELVYLLDWQWTVLCRGTPCGKSQASVFSWGQRLKLDSAHSTGDPSQGRFHRWGRCFFGQAGFYAARIRPQVSRNTKSTFCSVGQYTSYSIFRQTKMDSLTKRISRRLYEFMLPTVIHSREDLALGAKVSGPASSPDFCLSSSDRMGLE